MVFRLVALAAFAWVLRLLTFGAFDVYALDYKSADKVRHRSRMRFTLQSDDLAALQTLAISLGGPAGGALTGGLAGPLVRLGRLVRTAEFDDDHVVGTDRSFYVVMTGGKAWNRFSLQSGKIGADSAADAVIEAGLKDALNGHVHVGRYGPVATAVGITSQNK
jgi:hypothetical protein